MAVLHLVRDEAEKRDRLPVDVVFRDEELIPDNVIDLVDRYRQMDWVRMLWFAVPLESNKYVLGQTEPYVQWDPGRPWVREKPSWAITDCGGRVFDQYSMDKYTNSFYPKGYKVRVLGMRAAESYLRLQAFLSKVNDNWIRNLVTRDSKMANPVYDWSENDVTKYIHEETGETWARVYEEQFFAGAKLRVATPIHSEAAKQQLLRMKAIDPGFYDRLVQVFPDIELQVRYYKEAKINGVGVETTLDDVQQFIANAYRGSSGYKLAYRRFTEIIRRRQKDPKAYPAWAIMQYFQGGGLKRAMQAVARKDQK